MSFWELSDGGNAADTGTEFEIPGGNMLPIPDGSSVLAMIDEIKWDGKKDQYGNIDAEYINARWTVIAPESFKNRKIFQKLWVTDDDPSAKDADKAAKKRDKARRMLAAIDANAGGKLTKKLGKPTDDDLMQCISNKPMIIKCMVWSMDDRERPGEKIEGNWISAVSPKSKGVEIASSQPAGSVQRQSSQSTRRDIDDEIPF